ncbi:MAG: hypothetical protein ABL964_02160 [Steroidobacteraceae bacterium]
MLKVRASPSASLAEGENAYADPTAIDVAGLPRIVGARFATPVTVNVKAGSEVVTLPSLTLITIPECTAAVVGTPESRPVVVLKLAHVGLLAIEKPRVLPSASVAVGWKEQLAPTATDVAGVPDMTGARFATAWTVMLKVGREVDAVPSLTLILIPENVPAAVGVPASLPVLVLKVAHAGLPEMLKVKVLPSRTLADGWNVYAVPMVAVVGGTPAIVGGVFPVGVGAGVVAAVT